MAKRKRRTLPRATLLFLSSKDLLRFSEAVEKITVLVHDLAVITAELRARTAKKPPPKKIMPMPPDMGVINEALHGVSEAVASEK